MNAKPQKFYADLSRKLGNNDFLLKMYGLWLFGAFVLFGLFGIIPLIKNIYAKIDTINQINSISSQLNTKITNLQTAQTTLSSVQQYVPYLDIYIPSTVNIQNYLLDFVTAASASGYTVKSFVPDYGASDTEYSIAVVLEGDGDPQVLAKNIESLKRVTAVNSLQLITKTSGSKLVSVDISIFSGGTK